VHRDYQPDVPPRDHHNPPLADDANEKNPYYWVENWPLPTSWANTLFDREAWVALRPFRAQALKMGPLTHGTRRWAENPDDWYSTERNTGPAAWSRAISESMPEAKKALYRLENRRREQVRQILYLLQTKQDFVKNQRTDPDDRRDVYDAYEDSASDTEDEEVVRISTACPRWDEICQYLFNNRGPNELAWESMDFEIPEWTLYRYIQFRGGLNLSPTEWHDFLVVASERKELFRFVSHSASHLLS